MLGRVGIEQRDRHTLVVVAVVVGTVVAALADAPLLARVVVGVVGGIISAASFLLFTIVINVFKPDHW